MVGSPRLPVVTGLPTAPVTAWTVRVRKGNRDYAHAANELRVALAVACGLLRSGIAVERIDGPEGETVGIETIQEFCANETRAGNWRRAQLRFLSH